MFLILRMPSNIKSHFFYFLIFFYLLFTSCAPKAITSFGTADPAKSIFYHQTGKGAPILFIHGGPGLSHHYFLPSVFSLQNEYHLIFYDQRNCGESLVATDTLQMHLSSFIRDIDFVRKRMGYKKISLLGHSWGSMLAVRYAIQYPENVSNLILVSPAAMSSADVRETSRLINQKFEPMANIRRNELIESTAFKQGEPDALAQLYKIGFSQNMLKPEKVDSLNIYVPEDYRARNSWMKTLYSDLYDYDLYPQLKKIKLPTLILEGSGDVGVPQSLKISNTIPGSKYILIKESGHFPFLENNSDFTTAIRNFIRS